MEKLIAYYEKNPAIVEIVEGLKYLPSELVKGMDVIRKLDEKIDEGMEDLEGEIVSNPLTTKEEDIELEFREFRNLSLEKIAVVEKVIEILTTHIEDSTKKIEELKELMAPPRRKNMRKTRSSTRYNRSGKVGLEALSAAKRGKVIGSKRKRGKGHKYPTRNKMN